LVCKLSAFNNPQLEASTNSGRAGAVGMLQAILQVILQGAGPVGYCPKVLKGVLLIGRFVPRYCAYCLGGVLFLDPRSWVLCLRLAGRFLPGRCDYGYWEHWEPEIASPRGLFASCGCVF
jgi:hypothetical protein